MKENITKFDLDAAFRALDEIEVPKVKGIRANRMDLKEVTKRVDRLSMLVEDYYDVGDPAEMTQVGEERDGEVAKAKLARIEKIVDLDADSPEDLNPSYVGKDIIQCPQCMMLFYKNPEDIEASDGDPKTVNVGEVCQHCGNDSGYTLIGKVAAEDAPTEEIPTELPAENPEAPVEALPVEEIPAEEPAAEEAPAEEPQLEEIPNEEVPAEEEEKKEESFTRPTGSSLQEQIENILAEENNAYDEPDDEEAEAVERDKMEKIDALYAKKDSMSKEEFAKALDDIYWGRSYNVKENLTESKTINLDVKCPDIDTLLNGIKLKDGSVAKSSLNLNGVKEVNLTDCDRISNKKLEEIKNYFKNKGIKVNCGTNLTESAESDLDKKLKEHNDYIATLQDEIKSEEEAIKNSKNEFIKKMHEDNLASLQTALDNAIPAEVKEVANMEVADATGADELPELEDIPAEAIENKEEAPVEDKSTEEAEIKTESLHENLEEQNCDEADCTIHKAITHPDEDMKELNENDDLVFDDKAVEDLLDDEEFDKPVSDAEIQNIFDNKENFDKVDNFKEENFDKYITEFLNKEYQNVNNFTTTSCEFKNNTVIMEGIITFKSGKTKTTKFEFTPKSTGLLEGYNSDFSSNKAFKLSYTIQDSGTLLYPVNFKYSYTANKKLVEGLIR